MRAIPRSVRGAAAVTVLLTAMGAQAAPVQRHTVDQKGDFVVLGNTLGHDCATTNALPTPVVGMVGACGANVNDTSPDVFWQAGDTTATASTAILPADARSTAVLKLPAGATVTYARLYWSAALDNGSDNTAVIDRVAPDAFSSPVTSDVTPLVVTAAPRSYYQATAEITTLVQQHGAGAYRVGGVSSIDLRNFDSTTVYAAWWMVVFYRLDTEPLRNLTVFDGLDLVQQGAGTNLVTATLRGFLVPNAGFDAKLAVLAYEGDDSINGDYLAFNGTRLFNTLNPVGNFFNGTRSDPAGAVSNVGDLPQLTGGARSQSGFDLDVVNVTSLLTMGQNMVNIEAGTTTDFFILGGFVTSISTIKPDFTSTAKTFTNETRTDGVRAGDTLKFTISTTNNGNDPGTVAAMTDILPAGLTFVPGSIEITAGPNMGMKSDVAGDDQAEYTAASRTITVRLGTGATMTTGGTLAVGATTTVTFKVTVDASATGTIRNQAIVSAAGQSGAPTTTYSSDGNGPLPGTPPTDVVLDVCQMDSDCPVGKFCFTAAHPFVCGDCRTNADCLVPAKPVCDATSHTCRACTQNSDCTGGTPVCEVSSGRCVQCQTSADCSGLTPLCNAALGVCGPCTGDGPAGGCTDPARPACNTVVPLAGACTECTITNITKCGGAKPQCQTQVGLCGCSDRDGDSECGGNLSGVICNGPVGICTPGCSGAPMRNGCPPPQACIPPNGPVGVCNVPPCQSDLNCSLPRRKCDLNAQPATCVGCLVDADCSGAYVCDTGASKTCVECTATKTQNCTASNAGSRCLVNLTCGCAADLECGTNISGRVCNTDVSKCTYGCRGTGGNGCPPGFLCSSTDNSIGRCLTPAAADAGVTPDAAPDAAADVAGDLAVDLAVGTDAEADTASASPDAGADAMVVGDRPQFPDFAPVTPFPDSAAPITDDAGNLVKGAYVAGGGCKCNASGGPSGTGLWVALVVPVALLVRRRRRR
jgi:uncharacterized repeat protein (TIGR01451 family)/MYXO-CTERM domain-containing protein